MASVFFFATLLLSGTVYAVGTFERIESHCQFNPAEPNWHSEDYRFGAMMTRDEMAAKFERHWALPKRLNDRFYYDPQTQEIWAPIHNRGLRVENPRARVPRVFVETIRSHIEKALERKYAEHVFFSDMGHFHYMIPNESWSTEYASMALQALPQMLERIMADEEIKMLYHVAEQLKALTNMRGQNLVESLVPDAMTQWRYYTRNFLVDNRVDGEMIVVFGGSDSRYNTYSVSHASEDGYHFYSGVNLHADPEGCFAYEHKGETVYFDLTYAELMPASGSPYAYGP